MTTSTEHQGHSSMSQDWIFGFSLLRDRTKKFVSMITEKAKRRFA